MTYLLWFLYWASCGYSGNSPTGAVVLYIIPLPLIKTLCTVTGIYQLHRLYFPTYNSGISSAFFQIYWANSCSRYSAQLYQIFQLILHQRLVYHLTIWEKLLAVLCSYTLYYKVYILDILLCISWNVVSWPFPKQVFIQRMQLPYEVYTAILYYKDVI